MRRYLPVLILLLFFGFLPGEASAGKFLQVGVKTGQLRATPAPFGKILATPRYGERVEELDASGAWKRVRYGKTDGWMHSTLLTARAVELSAGRGNAESTATTEDLTLAGKGFNDQVESAYRRQNGKLDYATIDRMEKQAVTQKQMSSFLTEGGIMPEGGSNDR